MSYQDDLILSIYNRGEPGLAMGNIPPGKGGSPGQPYEAPKEDPKNPYVPAPKPKLAGVPDFPGGGYGSTSGAIVDLNGEAYFLIDGELIPQGGYDPAKHGDLIPHGGPDLPRVMMPNEGMMIAKKKKKKGLTIYEEAARRDAFRDMADEPYDPNTGRMGGGFDIINDVLGLDEA